MDGIKSGKITLRAARVLSGLTLKQAAAYTGISASVLGRYESDSGKTPCSIVVKLLRLYNIPTTDLVHIGNEEELHVFA